MKRSRILITGGSGFIGFHLVKAVKALGWEVTSVSLHLPPEERYVKGVEYLILDLTDSEIVKVLFNREFEYVVNLGGYIDHKPFREGGRELIESHFSALENLIEVLPRSSLKCFIQIGSSDEYGDAPSPQHEGLRESAISPYSMGKVASTHLLQMLHRTEDFPAIVVRLFLVYGPGQDSQRFLPQVIRACLSDQEFPTTLGEQERDFSYVEDVVQAIISILDKEVSLGEVFNIASGTPVTIRSVVEKVQRSVGGGKPVFGAIDYRNKENMSLYASIKKAGEVLSWSPKTEFDEGLARTIDFYRKYNSE